MEILIQTVLGQIMPQQMGITMCHEHLAMDLSHVRGEQDSVFLDRELILSEIVKLKKLGCKTIVEVSSEDMGRCVEDLIYYATQLEMNIIAATGAYLLPYHTPWILEATKEKMADFFMKELTVGMGDSGVKAGLIAEIATSRNEIHQSEEKVFLGAGIASKETGCAISTHCDMATHSQEQIELLVKGGAEVENIILGHMDLSDDVVLLKNLLSQGVTIAFDTIGKVAYLSDEKRGENMMELLSAGYEKQLVLSQDISRKSYMTKFGGKGYTSVLGDFVPMLADLGASKGQLEQMLCHNMARILNNKKG